jgi:hypothetical protein
MPYLRSGQAEGKSGSHLDAPADLVSRADGKNYLPLPTQPRLTTLSRKRKEYSQLVDQYFGRGLASLDQQVRPSDSRFSPQPGLTADMALRLRLRVVSRGWVGSGR